MSRRKRDALLALLAALGLVVGADRLRLASYEAYVESQTYEDIYYLPPKSWLKVFSLGWDEAFADLIWMRALVYYGQEFVHSGRVRYVFEYAEAIAELDPDFVEVYRWVGIAGLYRPQAITPEDIERAVRFMLRGAARFPEDGRLAWSIGAALVFELAPLLDDPEAKNDARRRGMPFLMRAVRLGTAPEWAVLSNASMLERIGQSDQAVRHLQEMLLSVRDPPTRARIEERIRLLRSRRDADAFLAAVNEEEEARRASFPYVSPDFFLLLGRRPPVDLVAPIRDGLPAALASPTP